MTQEELHRLARIGAEARLQELQREVQAIHTTFPALRPGASTPTPTPVPSGNRAERATTQRRRRPKMSREARQRIAAAQRKRWAEWKTKQGSENSAGDSSSARASKKR